MAGAPASVFGLPLGKALLPGASLPEPLEKTLEILNMIIPAQSDVFDLPLEHPAVQELKRKTDAWAASRVGEHPIALEENPQVVASLMVMYLRMLPHPVVPPKYYWTMLRLNAIPNPRARCFQIRILIHKMPAVCKNILLQMFSFLCATGISPDYLSNIFAKFLLRPTLELTDNVPPPCVKAVSLAIEQAEFICLRQPEPYISDQNVPPENPAEFKLEGSCTI